MRFRLDFDLTGRKVSLLLVLAVLVLSIGIGTAYTRPSAGHGADSVWVNIGGEEMSLQDAIDNNLIYRPFDPSMEANFGGMWGEPSGDYTNPLADNTKGCPSGYKDYTILGTANVDYAVHICLGDPTKTDKIAEFGGMYGEPSAAYANPLADNTKGCPSGFTAKTILGTANVDYLLAFCYSTDLNNKVVKRFGGAYGTKPYSGYPNPVSGGPVCPVGQETATVLGTANVDYSVHFCYEPL